MNSQSIKQVHYITWSHVIYTIQTDCGGVKFL